MAAWGADHGPVIILNTAEGSRPAHKHGRRSTLAHEICHLLIDRHGALPFSEVLGGYTPLYLEQRANACAAGEFEQAGLGVVAYPVDFQVSEGKRWSVMDFLPQAGALRNTERGIKEILGRIMTRI